MMQICFLLFFLSPLWLSLLTLRNTDEGNDSVRIDSIVKAFDSALRGKVPIGVFKCRPELTIELSSLYLRFSATFCLIDGKATIVDSVLTTLFRFALLCFALLVLCVEGKSPSKSRTLLVSLLLHAATSSTPYTGNLSRAGYCYLSISYHLPSVSTSFLSSFNIQR